MSKDENKEKLTDILKKVVNTGIGAAFMTEEAVRSMLEGLPLPKDILNGLLENAKETKNEFVGGIRKEFKEHLGRINVTREINKVLETYDIEVSAKLSFARKDQTPDDSTSVVKTTKKS